MKSATGSNQGATAAQDDIFAQLLSDKPKVCEFDAPKTKLGTPHREMPTFCLSHVLTPNQNWKKNKMSSLRATFGLFVPLVGAACSTRRMPRSMLTTWVCGLCEVNGPQVDRALVKGSRRSRCQHDHTKETNGRRPPKRPHNPNKKGEIKKTTKPNQPTSQPHTGTDQKPTPTGADRRQERTRTPHPPAQGRKAPMASRMLGEQASKQVNHGHATR